MKKALVKIAFFCPLFLFFCCHLKEKKQSTPILIPTVKKDNKKISIDFIGSIEFDKSFSFLQSPDLSKKEIDKLNKETKESNPLKMDTTHENLRNRFEELGIVKGRELLLSKFKYDSKPEFLFTDQFDKIIKIKIERDTVGYNNNKIVVFNNSDSSEIKIDFFMELRYAFLDIIPRGNKELVILNEMHVSNTDIYTFEVFEIKTRD